MYLAVVWDLSDVCFSALLDSLNSAVNVVSYFEGQPGVLGGAIYRSDSEGRAEELIHFFDFC